MYAIAQPKQLLFVCFFLIVSFVSAQNKSNTGGAETAASLKVGTELYNNGNYAAAISNFKEITTKYPSDSAYNALAYAYLLSEDYPNALQAANQSISLNDKLAASYNIRGMAHRKQQAFDLSIADFTKAIALAPQETSAYTNRQEAYMNKGAFQLTIDDCSKIIELDPTNQRAYRNRATAYFFYKRYEQGRGGCQQSARTRCYRHTGLSN